jgi:hypothetical protein
VRALPVIPLVDLGAAGLDRLALDMPDKVRLLSAAGRSLLSRPMLAFMDRRSRVWLARNETPYRAEIDAIAAIPGVVGAHGLNLSTGPNGPAPVPPPTAGWSGSSTGRSMGWAAPSSSSSTKAPRALGTTSPGRASSES